MKISASIYSNPNKPLEEIVKELDAYHVDYLHVDCNDDLSVFKDIETVRKVSKTPIDLHIITDKPEAYFEGIINLKIELVCFQLENLKTELEIPSEIKSKVGIAVMNDTPIEDMEVYFSKGFSFGLLMTTTPGKSGGTFNEETYTRILEFKKLFPQKALHVDGGVNDKVASKLRNLGVECSISGSYLLKAEEVGIALSKLKSDIDNLDFGVTEFMIRLNELPILHFSDLSLYNVIKTISDYKLAFCLIANNDGQLEGIITDGDLRNELLGNINDLNLVSVLSMINKKPLLVYEHSTVKDALHLIKLNNRQIMFLPVVDKLNKILGAVSINQLIKGSL